MRPTDHTRAAEIARDLESPVDVADLSRVLELLDRYSAPPAPTAPEALLARLRPLLPSPATRRFREVGLSTLPHLTTLRYFAAQVWLFRPLWWLGTLVATALGVALTRWLGLAPGLVVPPLVAGSLAYSFREAGTPAWEIELSCPVQPAQVLSARVAVVLSWVAILGACSSLLFGLSGLADWLAGTALFSGGALLAIVLTGPRLGAVLALMGWLFIALRPWTPANLPHLWGMPNGAAAAVGAACLVAALLLAPRLRRMNRLEG